GRGVSMAVKTYADRERVVHVFRAIPARIENTPPIIVAKSFRRARIAQNLNHVKHFAYAVIDPLANRQAVFSRENSGMKQQIECIYVVIEGLFEVNPIWTHLALAFMLQDSPA